MFRLKLLIVFLLVSFKSISQNVIQKDSVVVLTETQARDVAKDLVRYDSAMEIIVEQDLRIKNFQNKELQFKNSLKLKDSIIVKQKDIISIQKELVNIKKPFQIHGYTGIQSMRFTLAEPIVYAKVLFEIYRINAGVQYYVQPNNPSGYGIILEYKLF
jgi:hypothetical protein